MIEKLTAEQQDGVFEGDYECCAKALRIIDAQAAECERLRAELEDERERCQRNLRYAHEAEDTLESRLAAANALLKRVHAWGARQEKGEVGEAFVNIMCDVDRHLDGQARAPTRTEAEQRVLDAMAATPEIRLRDQISTSDDEHADACAAELARRGLKIHE